MKKLKTTIYIAECGRKYFSRSGALKHEGICSCWENPKNKTCKTCEHGSYYKGYSATREEPGENAGWDCSHKEFEEHKNHHHNVDYISVNCRYYLKRSNNELTKTHM